MTINTSGNKIDSWTNRFASARNTEKKQRSVSPFTGVLWNAFGIRLAIRKTGNISHHFHIPSISYSDCIPTALRMSTEITFHRSSTVLNGKEEESIQFPSSSRYITVCKLSELFKYLFITCHQCASF